ncbi:hypothetical protein Holit_02821 [Hollandina sp. SP2]
MVSSNPVNSVKTSFPMALRQDLRFKAAFPVLGNFDSHRPAVPFSVPAVCQYCFTLVMLLAPKMIGQFSFHGSLDEGLGKLFLDLL